MNIQTHCRQCAKAYQLGYAEATEYYRNQLSELLSIKSCPEPIMMVPINEECVAQNTKVATAPAGADGINPSQLSHNGPAHQIAVLPLAGTPSDNTSQPESVMPCVNAPACKFEGTDVCGICKDEDAFCPA
jgi:hypothetical protein